MAIDKELQQILKELKSDFQKSILPKVANKMKEIESEVIEENVYSRYEPEIYDRRMNDGGLSDTRNMQASYVTTRDVIVIEVENTTRGNQDYRGATTGYIQDIIESGEGYWNKALDERIGARPFIDETEDRIETSGEIDEVIMNELKKLGYDLI